MAIKSIKATDRELAEWFSKIKTGVKKEIKENDRFNENFVLVSFGAK